jgi:hypothetical protein
MSFASQNRRHHVMSPTAQAIATKALESLAANQTAADALRTTASVESPLSTGRVAFAEREQYGFSDVGFGLFTVASEDPMVPTVWQKEVLPDPVTGKQVEWLVVYTTDDEDIIRDTVASIASDQGGDLVPQGTRVFDRATGRHGTVQREYRRGIDKRMIVVYDETGQASFVDDPSKIEIMASKKASVSAVLRSVAEGPKKDVPIAPGVVTKNLTLDQGGQGGTAKVTVEFNDPQKGEEFFKQVEEMAGGVGGTESEPAEVPAKEGEDAPPEEGAAPPEAPAAGQGGNIPAPQAPAPQAPPMAMSSKRVQAEGLGAASQTPQSLGEFLRGLQPGQLWQVTTPQQPPMYLYIKSPEVGRIHYFRAMPTMNLKDFSDEAVENMEAVEFKNAVMWPTTLGVQPPSSGGSVQPHVMWNSKVALVSNGAANTPMASTIRNLTHFGSKIVNLVTEEYAGFEPVYSYVNEDGQKIAVPLQSAPKVGMTIRRPDTGELIRVGGVHVVEAHADDEDILANLMAVAVDVSDQVPPMGWTNSQSQNEAGEGGAQPLPPNPALQQGAPPTADTTNAAPLYDSQSAPEAGDKQKFQMSVDPNTNSVTVKFDKPPALDAIDQAIQGAQPPVGGAGAPPEAGAPTPAQPPPVNGQPKADFAQTENPTQF